MWYIGIPTAHHKYFILILVKVYQALLKAIPDTEGKAGDADVILGVGYTQFEAL